MATRVHIACLLSLLLVFPACRKDQPLGEGGLPSDCIPTPPTPMVGWNFIVSEHVVGGPRFNPNDGDEIMFVERPFGSQTNFNLHR